MSETGEAFFTSVGCMDGRCQEAIKLFGQDYFGAEFPDTITEAGLVGILAKDKIDNPLLLNLKKKLEISIKIHHSRGVLVYGHAECAGNPVNDEQHKEDVLKTTKVIRSLVDLSIPVIGVFVRRMEQERNKWKTEEVK